MNKAQREPYLILTEIPIPMWCNSGPSLCSFCRYAEWGGSCKEAEVECQHPLDEIVECGGDCWGFRPKVSQGVAIGMVSNWLQGKDVVLTDEFLLPSCRREA